MDGRLHSPRRLTTLADGTITPDAATGADTGTGTGDGATDATGADTPTE